MNVLKDVQSFFRSSPGEKRVIGRSLFGREIYAIKLGHGAPAGIVQYAISGIRTLDTLIKSQLL